MRALSCSVYVLAASALFGAPLATEPLAMDRVAGIMLVGAGLMIVLAFVLGRAVPAPAPFEGAMVTLLIAPIVLGVLCAAASDDVWPTWLVGCRDRLRSARCIHACVRRRRDRLYA